MRLRIRPTEECHYTLPKYVEISDENAKAMMAKFGAPGFSWYPLSWGWKVFYKDQWHVTNSIKEALRL